MNQPNFLFLLGGADLEMVEIKRLLTAHALALGKSDTDAELRWGARLSNYQNLFNDTQTFVGIELVQDIAPPPHYINIDHHNENSDKSSSLEQVIELLENNLKSKIEFTRDRQLIAANDKGYKSAMDKAKQCAFNIKGMASMANNKTLIKS
jgi:hypothetical protein